MSKFEYDYFFGGYDCFTASKERYSKEEAIEIARTELESPYVKYLFVGNGYVRHRAGGQRRL